MVRVNGLQNSLGMIPCSFLAIQIFSWMVSLPIGANVTVCNQLETEVTAVKNIQM